MSSTEWDAEKARRGIVEVAVTPWHQLRRGPSERRQVAAQAALARTMHVRAHSARTLRLTPRTGPRPHSRRPRTRSTSPRGPDDADGDEPPEGRPRRTSSDALKEAEDRLAFALAAVEDAGEALAGVVLDDLTAGAGVLP